MTYGIMDCECSCDFSQLITSIGLNILLLLIVLFLIALICYIQFELRKEKKKRTEIHIIRKT
jgi:hypothetical protein